jgi:hypothetical protein
MISLASPTGFEPVLPTTATQSYRFRRTLEKTQNQSSGHQDLIRVPGRFVKFYTLKATEELLNGAKLYESSQLTFIHEDRIRRAVEDNASDGGTDG